MPDQDIAAQDYPDDMWRGIYGIGIAVYTRYGRPTNGVSLSDIDMKANLSYGILAGPANNYLAVDGYGEEGSHICNGSGALYGSSACPNPYEPFYTTPNSSLLIDGPTVSITNSAFANAAMRESLPWQKVTYTPEITGNQFASAGPVANTETAAGVYLPGGTNIWNGAQDNYSGYLSASNSNMITFINNRVNSYNNLYSFVWNLYDADKEQPKGYPSIFKIQGAVGSYAGSSQQINGTQYVKTPGLAVDPNLTGNGQVHYLTINSAGSGYTPYQRIGCTIAQSTNTNVTIPGTSTPYTAACYGVANGAGQLANVQITQAGLGYLSAPAVTMQAPTSGTTATVTATVLPMQTYIPVGHFLIDSFYLPAGGAVAAYSSVTLSNLPCPDAFSIPDAPPSLQDHIIVTSMGSQTAIPIGLTTNAYPTGPSTCAVQIVNNSSSSYTYAAGTPSAPWELLIEGPNSGYEQGSGLGPQGILASSVATTTGTLPIPTLTATTASVGGAALAVGACATGTTSVSGATTSMAVSTSGAAGLDPGGNYQVRSYVSAAGTVTTEVCAVVAGTPTAQTYNLRVIQ